MKKVFYLSTCDTCKKIISELNFSDDTVFQDIKNKNISEAELEFVKEQIGSYEAIFSKRAQKFKDYKNLTLSEQDFKDMILKEYTFIKRPYVILNNKVFVGNDKNTIAQIKAELLKNV